MADIHEFPTFHRPIVRGFVMSRGYYIRPDGSRGYFATEPSEVPTHHHMSGNIIRLACFLAVIRGMTLRNMAMTYSELFRVPVTKSCPKRRIDEIGSGLSEDDIPEKLTDPRKPAECHIDGYCPLGTDRCVMVIKDDYDRILITHGADSENGDDAKKFLRKPEDSGVNITSVFSDYSGSFASAIREVFPEAGFRADHFHTAKNIRKHLKKALLGYGRETEAAGEKEKNPELTDIASESWKLRWSLLKKPSNPGKEERDRIEDSEKKDSGFVGKFRAVIRQIGSISDYPDTEKQAETKPGHPGEPAKDTGSGHSDKICRFSDEHRDQAMQYLKKRGFAKYGRSSNSESGMRIPRRLEKNHDGIRSEPTRKNYIKIYQVIKYLSEDITDFLATSPET